LHCLLAFRSAQLCSVSHDPGRRRMTVFPPGEKSKIAALILRKREQQRADGIFYIRLPAFNGGSHPRAIRPAWGRSAGRRGR
jgi:hypothetical protein